MPPRNYRLAMKKSGRKYEPKALNKTQKAQVREVIKTERKKNSELKFFRRQLVFASVLDFNGAVESVSDVPQGDLDSNRNGDRLTPVSLRLSYTLYGETNSFLCRFIVFRWLENTVPTVADILIVTGSGYAINGGYQHDQRHLFNILYDKAHVCSNNGNENVIVTKTLKMAAKQIDYTAASTAGSNKIYVLGITDRNLATSGTVQYVSRLNYYDN